MHARNKKAWKGKGMEGWVARWYTRTRRNDMNDFQRQAGEIVKHLHPECEVLEVAPGPGFFAIELAKLGRFHITGLDISRTLVAIATDNARNAGVEVDFRWGSASAMPFPDESVDFVYSSAAFKNFSEPIEALNEAHRVLRPGGEAIIADLRKDASLTDIDGYVRQSGRGAIDAWLTKWTFRHMLLKRAYSKDDFIQMAKQSRFGTCQIKTSLIELEVGLVKTSTGTASVG